MHSAVQSGCHSLLYSMHDHGRCGDVGRTRAHTFTHTPRPRHRSASRYPGNPIPVSLRLSALFNPRLNRQSDLRHATPTAVLMGSYSRILRFEVTHTAGLRASVVNLI